MVEHGADPHDRRNPIPIVPLRVGGMWVAVPALAAVEIVSPRDPLPLPLAPAHVPGLVSLRGRAVPLLDLARFLQLDGAEQSGGFPRLVLVEQADMRVAVWADQVLGVIAAGELVVRDTSVACGLLQQFAIGELDAPFGIVTMLDVDALLEAARVRD